MPGPWEKFQNAQSEPDSGPWAKYGAPPPTEPKSEPGTLSKLGSAFWEGIGGKAVVDLLGGASRDPERAKKAKETAMGIVESLRAEPGRVMDELGKSGEAMVRGDVADAASHLGGAVPLVGGPALQVQHDFENADYSTGFGHALAMLLPFASRNAGPVAAKVGDAASVVKRAATDPKLVEAIKGAPAKAVESIPIVGKPVMAVAREVGPALQRATAKPPAPLPVVERPAPAWQAIPEAQPAPVEPVAPAAPAQLPSGRLTPAQRGPMPAGPVPNAPSPAPGAPLPIEAPARPLTPAQRQAQLAQMPAKDAMAIIEAERTAAPPAPALSPAEALQQELTGATKPKVIPSKSRAAEPATALQKQMEAQELKTTRMAQVMADEGVPFADAAKLKLNDPFWKTVAAKATEVYGEKVNPPGSLKSLDQMRRKLKRLQADKIAQQLADETAKN